MVMGGKHETRELCIIHWQYEGPKRTKALDELFAEAALLSVTVDPVSRSEILIEAPEGFHFAGDGLHEYVCVSVADALARLKFATFEKCEGECEWWHR